jgi:outer membrane protein assembly factor BamB
LVFLAGSSNTFFAVNAADGTVVWHRTLPTFTAAKEEPYYLCPNTPNATPVIDKRTGIVYTISVDGRLYGLDLATGDVKFGPFALIPAYAKAWSLNLQNGTVFTTTSQACGGDRSGIYSMRVDDPLRIQTHELLVRRSFGGGLWLRGGTVIDSAGKVFVSTGDGGFDPALGDYSNAFLRADSSLAGIEDYYSPVNWSVLSKRDLDLPSGGLLEFKFGDRPLLTGGGKESVAYLLDPKQLGGTGHSQPLYASPVLANEPHQLEEKGMWGSPAVWADQEGQPWIYIPVWGALASTAPHFPRTNGDVPHGSILAFKVVGSADKPQLQPEWTSPDMDLPDAPVTANGLVFAVATGENPRQDHQLGVTHFKSMEDWRHNLLTTDERNAGTHPAVLVVLDARTGKLLFQSGDSMKSWVHFTGLAVSGGKVFAVDHQSRLYCFGLKNSGR